MAIANTVRECLSREGVDYTIVSHPHTASSSETAEAAHVSGEQIAKGVVVKDERGYVLALLPTSHTLALGKLGSQLDRSFELVRDDELGRLVPDCELGAVPALGPAYGLETVVSESLMEQPDIYFEAGDHEELVHIDTMQFKSLLYGARFETFSSHKP